MIFESNILDMLILHEGQDGLPGTSKYIWVKYSMYPDGTDLTDNPNGAIYIGIAYNKDSTQESNIPSDYTWSKIKGDDGADAFTMILSNENVSIATSANNKVVATQTFTASVQIFQGVTEITDFTVGQIDNLYEGLEIKVENKEIILTAKEGNTIPIEYGSYVIPVLIANEIPVYKELTWNLSKQGADGKPGKSPINVIVCNESQNIPCDKDGYVLNDIKLEIPFYAFEGLDRVECSASYGVLPDGMVYASNLSDNTSGIDSQGLLVFNIAKGSSLGMPEVLTGKVEIVFTVGEQQTKRYFSWTKSMQGADGLLTLYEIKPSCEFLARSAVTYSDTGAYKIMPGSVTFSASYTQTLNEGKHEFSGFFRIEETVNNSSSTIAYQSTKAESSVVYTADNTDVTNIKCTLYKTNDFALVLDTVNIPVISDESIYDAVHTLHTEMQGVKSIIDPNADPPCILEQAWKNSQVTVTNKTTGEVESYTFTDILSSHETSLHGIEQRVKSTETTLEDNTLTLKEHQTAIEQQDNKINIAVSSAESALSQVDNKNSNFTTKDPEETIAPPYVKGDLWVRTVYIYNDDGTVSTDEEGNSLTETVVYQCNTTVEVGGEFDESHWEIADYATTGYVEAAISVEADKMALLVSDSGKITPASIILAINGEDESEVTISAEKVNLDGYVAFTNLETSGETTIDGGNIKTETITADKIVANSITGDRIAANTLTSEQIDVNSLFAEEIDATNGSITNATMTNAEIKNANISDATIIDAEINNCTINSSLHAENLVGKISDKTGKNSWDLSTGELTISGNDSGDYVTDNDLSTSGSTSINGANIQTGTIGASQIDVDDLFAQSITATDMTITGTSKFITEDDNGAKATIQDGAVLCEYSSDDRLIAVTYESIKLCTPSSEIDVPIEFWNLSSDSISRIGKIGKGGFYSGNNDNSPFLDWQGNFNGKKISSETINATSALTVKGVSVSTSEHVHNLLQHGDGTGNVLLGKDAGSYYFRPSNATSYVLGSSSNPWVKTWTKDFNASGNASVTGSLSAASVTVSGKVSAASETISGNASVGGTLTVTGQSTFNARADFNDALWCKDVYSGQNLSSTDRPVVVGQQGRFKSQASSSRRYKHDIEKLSNENLNQHKLYDINVVQFKYNKDILAKDDQRYMIDVPGFIAEDVYEKYPIAADIRNGQVDDWNHRYLIPPMLKLIQEQHEEIDILKEDMKTVKAENDLLKSQLSSIMERLEKLENQGIN